MAEAMAEVMAKAMAKATAEETPKATAEVTAETMAEVTAEVTAEEMAEGLDKAIAKAMASRSPAILRATAAVQLRYHCHSNHNAVSPPLPIAAATIHRDCDTKHHNCTIIPPSIAPLPPLPIVIVPAPLQSPIALPSLCRHPSLPPPSIVIAMPHIAIALPSCHPLRHSRRCLLQCHCHCCFLLPLLLFMAISITIALLSHCLLRCHHCLPSQSCRCCHRLSS